MSYEWIPSPNFKSGRTQPIRYIVIHHWDDPAKRPALQGVVNHFKNPAIEVSAHYVVTGDQIIQMVKESDTAWHAVQANPYTIGIEVDPLLPGNTYATVGRLVREIRGRHGNLPLRKHSEFVQTSCPGNLDIGRIESESTLQRKDETMTVKEIDEMIAATYVAIAGRNPADKEFVFHREQYARQGDAWWLQMVKGFRGDDIAWKKYERNLKDAGKLITENPDAKALAEIKEILERR